MSNAAQPSLLRRLMGLRATPAPEQDPADMGTAMGLDFCLDEPPSEAVATPPPAPSGRANFVQMSWLRRLSAS
jgi:hypothetical protein